MYMPSVVRRVASPPFAGIRYRSSTSPPPDVLRNTIQRPSGEKIGVQSEYPGPGEVMKCGVGSSIGTNATRLSLLPFAVSLTAICFPSGDQEISLNPPATQSGVGLKL